MPIIVGTMIDVVTPCSSIASSTAPGSNIGIETRTPPIGITPIMPPVHRRRVEHRRLGEPHGVFAQLGMVDGAVVEVQHL